MRIPLWLVSIIVAAACCAACSQSDEARTLDGTWVWSTLDGKEIVASDEDAWALISDDRLTLHVSGKVVLDFAFTLNPHVSPKEMDLCDRIERGNVGKLLAIYDLNGDTLQICLRDSPHKEKPRPRAFTSDSTTGLRVITLTRKSS